MTHGCFNPRAVTSDFTNVIAGCPGYLYFDSVYPTTAVHRLLANGFAQAVPEPATYGLTLRGLVVPAAVSRHRSRT